MIDKIISWFLDTEHQYMRSATCFLCIIATIVGIWWVYCIPCDSWAGLAIDAAMIAMVILAQSAMWPLLEYIIKNDSYGR